MRSRVCLAVVWLGLATQPLSVRAAELGPKDTAKLESLTPAEARQLTAAFKGKNLFLNGLTGLPVETAAALAEHEGGMLFLDGLTRLDAAAAASLAAHQGGQLYLNGLASLDAATARALAG
jgi:hypothetical protein